MYAVIRTGGKQYKVAPQDVLQIEKIQGEAGDAVQFPDVLMVAGEGEPSVGSPLVDGAVVSAEVVEQGRGPKVIIFKKKRRQNYRRKRGHRQDLTTVRILEILTDAHAPAKAHKEAEAPAAAHEESAAEAQPAKARAKKAEAGAAPETQAAVEAEVKKAKSAKPAAADSAEAKEATPKKPRAKKAE
ncbi:MAG: 50S ribosomal protein L21 [Rhodomicrobium sp.]